MGTRGTVQIVVLSMGIGLLSSCFGGRGTPSLSLPGGGVEGWEIRTTEYIALWYHSLAFPTAVVPPAERPAVPRFAPEYTDEIEQITRREGRYPTPVMREAGTFGRTFQTSDAYEGLEFLPLYFEDAEALYSGIEVWERAGGNPYNAPVAGAVPIIEFLSRLFPRSAERESVARWTELVQEEDVAFYQTHWAAIRMHLEARAGEVQEAWNEIEPEIREFLEFVRYRNAEVYLVPALGPEGRSVIGEGSTVRMAILEPPPGRPEEAVWSIVHEILYPLVDDIIPEYVAPAQRRELGEERLASIAAVRGGAILLDRRLPQRAEEYRRFFLAASGEEGWLSGNELEEAFQDAFPLPEGLIVGLEDGVRLALAGI